MDLEPAAKMNSLHVVNLANPDLVETAGILRKACMEVGFFYLINHGIDQELIDEVFEQSKRFFALSLEEKMKILADEKYRGYTPFENELLDPGNQSKGEFEERYFQFWSGSGCAQSFQSTKIVEVLNVLGFWNIVVVYKPSLVRHSSAIYMVLIHVIQEIVRKDTILGSTSRTVIHVRLGLYMVLISGLHLYLTRACNQKYSELLPQWRETMDAYYEQALKLGVKLASMLALALNMEATYFEKDGMFDCPMAVLRLLHYSAEISNPAQGIYGCGAHSDYGLLTLLTTDDAPGLQICKNKDASPQIWEEVTPMKGAYIVNLGDMLERWSNGLFRSTLHRVVSSGTERYSVPFFFEPNFDAVVECLPSCCSDLNPSKYPTITSGQHLLAKYEATHSAY